KHFTRGVSSISRMIGSISALKRTRSGVMAASAAVAGGGAREGGRAAPGGGGPPVGAGRGGKRRGGGAGDGGVPARGVRGGGAGPGRPVAPGALLMIPGECAQGKLGPGERGGRRWRIRCGM